MRIRALGAAAFVLAVAWIYAWTPASFPFHVLESRPVGIYPELSQALLAGQLHLPRAPDPRLAALADPYDPAQNAAYRANNLSYFRGRYYAYMGIAPALAVFIPVKLVTGRYPSQEAATVLLCLIGSVAGIGLLWRLRATCLPKASNTALVAGGLAVAFAGGFQAALPGSIAQEVAVASGYASAMLALGALGRALSGPSPRIWLALASLFLGAAIASRPNYAIGALVLAGASLIRVARRRRENPAGWRRTAACGILPLAVVIAGLLAYNYARFGSVFEFGQRYMLGQWDQRHLGNFSLGAVSANAANYLFSAGLYSPYFPFVTASTSTTIGVLRHLPWLWLAPVVGWALVRVDTRSPARTLGFAALVLGTVNVLTLLSLPSGNPGAEVTSANARYILDFLPEFTVFVAIGVLAASDLTANSRALRLAGNAIAVVAALASAGVALSLDFQRFPPESYRPLAEVMDLPSYALLRLRGARFGPVGAEVVFPPDRVGAYEPLLETGGPDTAELLYVHYAGPQEIQFGLVGTGLAGPLSEPIPLSYGVPHRVVVSLGSLYPPVGYPGWAGFTDSQVAVLRRSLRVDVDGRAVFDAPAYFYAASPSSVRLGTNSFLSGYSAPRFSGRIIAYNRRPISVPPSPPSGADFGALRLTVRFPPGLAGVSQPLVVTGVPQAGDFLFVRYVDAHHLAFGIDHWGFASIQTRPLPCDVSASHTLTVSMGSLFPPLGHRYFSSFPVEKRDRLKRHVQIVLDGVTVLDADYETYESSPYDVSVGRNAIGGSTCDYAFTGTIERCERLPLVTAARALPGAPHSKSVP